jgi:two-component system nitrate/nitrite response regulator NarL
MHCARHIAPASLACCASWNRNGPCRRSLSKARKSSLVDQGRSNEKIARQLSISAATVKNHSHNLLQKLQASGRGQASGLRGHLAA